MHVSETRQNSGGVSALRRGQGMPKAKTIGIAVAVMASGLLLTSGSSSAACDATPIGATTGNPEKDTVGLACAGQGSNVGGPAGGDIALGQRSTVQIGGATGNPEKDTFGYAQTPAQ